MKVKCLRSFSGMSFNGTIGEVKDFPDEIASDLINAGYAESIGSVATSQQNGGEEANRIPEGEDDDTDTDPEETADDPAETEPEEEDEDKPADTAKPTGASKRGRRSSK